MQAALHPCCCSAGYLVIGNASSTDQGDCLDRTQHQARAKTLFLCHGHNPILTEALVPQCDQKGGMLQSQRQDAPAAVAW